jgi:hypothetical protein
LTVATATSHSAHNLPGKTVSQRQEKNLKVISDTTHGILDYLTVAIFALAPSILGLTGFAALVSYALAAIHLAMTLLTNMPLGVIKIIPMRLHALVEMIVGPVLVVAAVVLPTILGDRREFFLVMGLVILAVWLLSSYGRSAITR